MTFRRLATICLSAAIAFSSISCSDDDDKETFDGEIFSIKSGYSLGGVEREDGDGSSYYRQYVLLAGPGISVNGDEFTGTGDAITISFNTPEENFEAGTYTLSGFDDDITDNEAFDINYAYANYGLDGSKPTEKPTTVLAFEEATLKVSKSGDTYTFHLVGTAYPEKTDKEWSNGPDLTKAPKKIKAEYKGRFVYVQGS